ncbi:hypothetical protein [Priestia aryabhattai]
MGVSIFSKKKSLESVYLAGQDNIIAGIIGLVFLNAPIKIKRTMLFIFGLLWAGTFAYFLITGKY